MKRYVRPVFCALGMLVLILDSRTALSGAAEGVGLCIRTLIPSLLPFFLLSALLTGSLPGGLLLAGILGGYPVGAVNTAQAFQAGQISRAEAENLVVLCNCAGPSFLFGVLGQMFESPVTPWLLWGIYLASVGALWLILPKSGSVPLRKHPPGMQQALHSALRAMAGVCGWVVIFRVLLAILDHWILWLLPEWGRAAAFGILELSNGCMALDRLDPGPRFVLAAGMLGFGGLCVMMQTAGAAEGISMGRYFPGKVFQGAVCVLLAALLSPAVSPAVPVFAAGLAAICGISLGNSKKRCGNPRLIGV